MVDNSHWIQLNRQAHRLGHTAHIFESCGSTNEVAMNLAREGCADGTLVLSKHQTQGKGRHGRAWESWQGNLILSVVIRPKLKIDESYKLVLNSALAAANALKKFGVSAFIKWPNDLLILAANNILVGKLGAYRKIGGILLEVISTNQQIDAAVLGIGINLVRPPQNQNSCLIPQMGFVQDIKDIALPDLINALLNELELYLQNPFNEANHQEVLEQVRRCSALLGKNVRAECGSRTIFGIAEDLLGDGGLIIRLEDGKTEQIFFGDVHLESANS